MTHFRTGMTVCLTVVFALVLLGSSAHAQVDPIRDEWNMMDLLFARPASVLAGVAGTALFVVTLPFTVPTGGVEASADMFMVQPFKYAFDRPFPDEQAMR